MTILNAFKPVLPINCHNAHWATPLTILVSIAALIISAKIQIPTLPVPITLQSAVVVMLPVLFGWQMALTTLTIYFIAGLSGAPVFAFGALAGPAYFLGTTGGYLIGFALAILTMGAALKYYKPTFLNLVALMIIAHAVILICGTFWLAYGVPSLGLTTALATGFLPFITGALLKSGFTAAFARYITKT